MNAESVTLLLVNLASIMQRADESLLPGVYKEVGATLHTDPTGLGSLTLFRSIVQSSCYPLAAYLSMRHNRARVIALGAFLWAAATFLVAVSRGLNGIGLAIVTPAIQSLVADSTDESNRGTAFGWLQLTGNIGSIIGGLCSVLIASTSFMGIPGWRIAFHLVGLISVIVEMKDLVKEAKSVIRIPSFQILIAQGVFGSFPWSGLSFAPLWLELIGFSHKETAVLWTLFIIGGSLGSLFGGIMGDTLAKPFPNAGRIVLSQISAGSAIPFAAILLLVLPDDPTTGFSHGLVLFVMGWFTSWNAPATNNQKLNYWSQKFRYLYFLGTLSMCKLVHSPIFAEIVPERSRTSIYALDQSFESILSSFAPPIVGLLAQHVYGFEPVPKGSSDSVEVETDRENAASLAKALYTAMGIPMTLCVFIYSFLYCTYPRDRDRARMQALAESEMQQLETNCSPSRGEYSEVHVSESKILNGNEKSEIDIEYGLEEVIDLDDKDEKSLLSDQQTFSNLRE
ncbi:hypothetical protein C1H46_022682 [Malus baccata]|uniref:Major facilitator superfamily (MFS) profile domain-containing protein n=1 Tax=Malus baccata TaxID=106549 RepID=A0A540LZM6_MALBA|nr:hypothetical protein C1H46_022682 [Malus baccata]